ncbi:hypothetical protein LP419_17655 [Massilia sp. H-1]|nr:hypothetical protein LP419_17655 [Massilia sp. H-1]
MPSHTVQAAARSNCARLVGHARAVRLLPPGRAGIRAGGQLHSRSGQLPRQDDTRAALAWLFWKACSRCAGR